MVRTDHTVEAGTSLTPPEDDRTVPAPTDPAHRTFAVPNDTPQLT